MSDVEASTRSDAESPEKYSPKAEDAAVVKDVGKDQSEDLSSDESSKEKEEDADLEGTGESEVETILGVKFDKNGKPFFLIKWLGWGSNWNSYEPEENLHCPEKVAEFEERERVEFFNKYGYNLRNGTPQVGVRFGHRCEKVLALHRNPNGGEPSVLVKWAGTAWQTVVSLAVAKEHL